MSAIAALPRWGQWRSSTTPASAPLLPVLRILPVDAARVPADQAMRRDQERHAFEELAVAGPEGPRNIRVDVDLGDHQPLVHDRDDDLRTGRDEAGQVAVVRVDVGDDLGPSARRGGAADPAPDRDADVL